MPVRLAALAALVATAVLAAPAHAALHNPADDLLRHPLDALRSDGTSACTHVEQPGALGLEAWLASRFVGEPWGIENCRNVRGGARLSLHAEGRALDWRLDSTIALERKHGDRIVSLLIRRDRRGRPNALARRMGVQEIIWNCRIWTPLARGLRFYSPCRRSDVDPTTAHRDHVHIGLNWRGARLKTTFWRFAERPPARDPAPPSVPEPEPEPEPEEG